MARRFIRGMSFSWKRALGFSGMRYRFARRTGIPTTQAGAERKLGRLIVQFLTGRWGRR